MVELGHVQAVHYVVAVIVEEPEVAHVAPDCGQIRDDASQGVYCLDFRLGPSADCLERPGVKVLDERSEIFDPLRTRVRRICALRGSEREPAHQR